MSKATRALIDPFALEQELAGEPVSNVDLSRIVVREGFNPRTKFSPGERFTTEALAGLAESIRSVGVLSPLLVRPRKGKFELVAGERRFHAAKLAGLTQVPVIIKEVSDAQALEIALIENSQRENLDLVAETFNGFAFLEAHLQRPLPQVVEYLNNVRKKRTTDEFDVEQHLRRLFGTGVSVWSQQRAKILSMTDAEREAIKAGDADAKVLYELVTLPSDHPQRAELLRLAIKEKLSAEDLRRHVLALRHEVPHPTLEEATVLKRQLKQLSKLSGKDAERAQKLLRELNELLQRASSQGKTRKRRS